MFCRHTMSSSFISLFIFWLLNDCYYSYKMTCPDECNCGVRSYDCSEKSLSRVPSGIPVLARSLDLKKNEIKQLQKNMFVRLKLLRTLNIGFNQLTEIKDDNFNGLVSLRTLDLSFNQISTIQKYSFKNLDKITDLVLRSNQMTDIEGVFVDMQGLNRLDLSKNQIERVTPETFRNMTNLRYLLIGSNLIKYIHVKAFHDLKRLTYISMSGNPIGNVNGLFVGNNILTFIELRNCSLDSFPKGLPLVVRFLYLDQNQITSISKKEIERVENLVNFILSENQIKTIQKDAFKNLTGLAELWINFNFIKEIPVVPVSAKKLHMDNNKIGSLKKEDFPLGSELETLSLKNNQIATINQNTFENLKNLKNLFLGGNNLSQLPDYAFKSLPLLDELGLIGLDINYITPETFEGLKNLDKLTLSFGLISDGALQGNIFEHLTNLRILDIQDSPSIAVKLLDSEEMLQSLFTLEELNLMNNDLHTINTNLMTYMPRLIIIKLGGNKFHCDRRLLWLKNWIDMQKYKFEQADFLECASPPELSGKSILSLNHEQFVPTTLKPIYLSTKGLNHFTTTQLTIQVYNSSVFNQILEKVNVTENNVTIVTDTTETTSSYPNRQNSADFQNRKKKIYEEKFNKILLISVVTVIPIVLFVVIVTVVVCLKCNRRKEGYHQTNSFADNDVTFFVISDEAPPLPPPNPIRMNRESMRSSTQINPESEGSISSDITEDNDSSRYKYI